MRIPSLWLSFGLLLIVALPSLAQETPKKTTRAEGENALLSKVPPAYPPIGKQLRIQGTVELEATVTPEGDVEKVSPVSGSPVLTKPAVEAVKKWKFKPFLTDGKAVVALVPITIAFKL